MSQKIRLISLLLCVVLLLGVLPMQAVEAEPAEKEAESSVWEEPQKYYFTAEELETLHAKAERKNWSEPQTESILSTNEATFYQDEYVISQESIALLEWNPVENATGYILEGYDGEGERTFGVGWDYSSLTYEIVCGLEVGTYEVRLYTVYQSVTDWDTSGDYSTCRIKVTGKKDAGFSIQWSKAYEEEDDVWYNLSIDRAGASSAKFYGFKMDEYDLSKPLTCGSGGYRNFFGNKKPLSATVPQEKGTTYWHWAITDTGEVSNPLVIDGDEQGTYTPTIENFTVNGKTSEITVEAGGTLTLGGTVRGNGDTIKAIQVSVFQNGDHTLGGVCQHLEPGTENFDLSDFDPIVTGETYGNLDMNEGTYDICIYVTLGNGGSFGDDLPTRTVTVIPAGSCAHTAASMIYVETLYREIEGDHVNHQAYADIYSGICDICGSSFETTCLRVEEDIETVCHSYSGGVCQSNGCGHVCPHAWDFKLNNGEPVPVSGSGVWKMVDETSCQKNVRYWMQCAYCAEEKKGTELYPEANNILPHDSETTTEIAQLPTDDVDYNTKHQLTTTHVACTRDCGYTAGSGTEVTKEDHTLLDGICECGYAPVWHFERDSFSFMNNFDAFGEGQIYVKQEHLDKWLAGLSDSDCYNVARNTAQGLTYMGRYENLKKNNLKDWNGACYGMTLAMGLFKTNVIQTEWFSSSENVKKLPALTKDNNSDLESILNIMHMTQFMSYMQSTDLIYEENDQEFEDRMKELFNYALSINQDNIDSIFMFNLSGHCIICFGAENGTWIIGGTEYSHRFIMADPNCITKAEYVYTTNDFSHAFFEHDWSKEEYNPTAFGARNVTLDADLFRNLSLDLLFGDSDLQPINEQSRNNQSQRITAQKNKDNQNVVIIDLYGDHACKISCENGSIIIKNGVVYSNSLNLQVHKASLDMDVTPSNDCYILLPAGIDYCVTPIDSQSLDMTVKYDGLLFAVNGKAKSIIIGEDRVISISGEKEQIYVDVVNDNSVFDFLNLYGKPEGKITVQAEYGKVQVDGDWAECTASHMTRDLETIEVEIADPSNFTVTIDEENNLSVEPTPLVGDVNGDGMLSSADAVLLARYLLGSVTLTDEQLAAADINSDGVITTADTVLLAKKLLAGN